MPTDSRPTADPAVVISELGGICPIQGEGTVNGKPFYFRARGEQWSMGIGGEPVGEPEWEHAEYYGKWPEAGWISEELARAFIWEAARRYAAGVPGGTLQEDGERGAKGDGDYALGKT